MVPSTPTPPPARTGSSLSNASGFSARQPKRAGGDITVLCRVRPAPANEEADAATQIRPPNVVAVMDNAEFAFDCVLGPEVTQQQVFDNSGRQMVDCVLAGFNSTVLVYGQTNAGKTFTMTGTGDNPGLVERFARHLFDSLSSSATAAAIVDFSVQASYVEIYLEQVRDLLLHAAAMPREDAAVAAAAPLATPGGRRRALPAQQTPATATANLQIRENAELGIHIPDATVIKMATWQDLVRLCRVAQLNRATSETQMNQESSRSHSVLLLHVTQVDSAGTRKTSKVSMVDLAGSEQVKRTGAEGDRLTEAQAINSSLSALGNVIHALTSSSSSTAATGGATTTAPAAALPYIPYRDSKLTRLLQESLGGNAKTWLIVNVSPLRINMQETLSTLRFGQRAKAVKNNATVNAVKSAKELEQELKRANERIAAQQEVIRMLRGDGGRGGGGKGGEEEEDEDPSTAAAATTAAAAAADGEQRVIMLEHHVADLQAKLAQTTQERDAAQEGWERAREQLEQQQQPALHQQPPVSVLQARLDLLIEAHRKLLRLRFTGGEAGGAENEDYI